jgi:hypothetical protein
VSFGDLSHHPVVENDKHQEWKSKNACHATMLDGSTINQAKECTKHAELRHREHMEYDGMSGGMANQGGKC